MPVWAVDADYDVALTAALPRWPPDRSLPRSNRCWSSWACARQRRCCQIGSTARNVAVGASSLRSWSPVSLPLCRATPRSARRQPQPNSNRDQPGPTGMPEDPFYAGADRI